MLKRGSFLTVAVSAMGISVLVQALALFRQLLIAAYFGVSRDLDVYLIAYAIATMVVFTFSTAFDSAVVPRLVRAGAEGGEGAARTLAAALFRWSLLLGAVACLLMVALAPLLAPVVATGFEGDRRAQLAEFVWHFVPWAFLSLPYYAAAARHKAMRSFNRVFGAEIAIGAVSIAVLVAFHADVHVLPWAYAAGYLAALAWVLPGTGILSRLFDRGGQSSGTGHALRNVGELYLANQTGSLTTIVDRHYQSLVAPGGIAALGYSTQVITGLVGLLTFREIYIVPLAEPDRREEKLERLVIGLLALVLPLSGFLAVISPDFVQVLFQRGRFDADATALTASILSIATFGLIPAAISNPLMRTLQIVDRISSIHVIYLSSVVFLGAFGFVFVRLLAWDAEGLAWMLVANGFGNAVVAAVLVRRCGIVLRWRRIAAFAFAIGAASAVASVVTLAAVSPFDNAWVRLFAGAAGFGVVIAGFYYAMRAHLLAVSGHRPTP